MKDVWGEWQREELVMEPLLKRHSGKQAIHKYLSSPHYESDFDQLCWTIRINVIEIF